MVAALVEHSLFRVANKLQSKLAVRAAARMQQSRIQAYLQSGRRPWSTGYNDYKMQSLKQILADEVMLAKFKNHEPLPAGYAARLDARLIEIPWVLSHIAGMNAVMLDAGSSLNHLPVLEAVSMKGKQLTILTLAPEKHCYWNKWDQGISYLFDDMRALPFRDNHFDVIACISTIEHIGMDNAMYAGSGETGKAGASTDFLVAVSELRRVLKPTGLLYITFPFGRYENHGWFQQFDSSLVDKLIQGFTPTSVGEAVYRYTADGWNLSNRADCSQCEFFDVHGTGYFDSSSTIDFPSDFPAGERAVACLELRK